MLSESKNTISSETYYCFVADSGSIWYRIPVIMRNQFYNLLDDNEKELKTMFFSYRCLHPINYMFPVVEVLKES
jgi:hypothetical protein